MNLKGRAFPGPFLRPLPGLAPPRIRDYSALLHRLSPDNLVRNRHTPPRILR